MLAVGGEAHDVVPVEAAQLRQVVAAVAVTNVAEVVATTTMMVAAVAEVAIKQTKNG